MPRTLSAATISQKNLLASPNPYFWLVRLKLAGDNEEVFLSSGNAVSSYDPGDGIKTWTPFPLAMTQFDQLGTGNISQFGLSVSDESGELTDVFRRTHGLVGQKAFLFFVNKDLGTGTINLVFPIRFSVKVGQVIDGTGAAFELGRVGLSVHQLPATRARRRTCRKRYKGPLCKYDGSIPFCTRGLLGENGCIAHENTPNFGGFMGIPRDL